MTGAYQQHLPENQPGEIYIIELVNVVLRFRRPVIAIIGILFTVVIALALLKPRTYTATASFMPKTSESNQSLAAGLAAQFGMLMPATQTGESPGFYADLIKSGEILQTLVETQYSFSRENQIFEGNLIDLYEIDHPTYDVSREIAISRLTDNISVRIDRETGVVNLSVVARWPALTQQILNQILALLNKFNLENRQSGARAERQFIEDRLGEVGNELREAEDQLQEFLQQNPRMDAPELEFIHDRLQREVLMQQQVVTTIRQAYEQARIDEVRDTPVITIVERPRLPVIPNSRKLFLNGFLAIVIGLILGVLSAFGCEFMRRSQQEVTEEGREFAELKRETALDLTHPWRLFRRSKQVK